MKEECIDVKRFDALISHEEWWCYDLFATAASLALKVPHFCCDWTLSHFVVAQGYWSSSNAVMECAPEKLTVIQAAEEKMIEAAFRGRHCWSEKMCDYMNCNIFPHEIPVKCTKRQFLCVFLLIASCHICIECFKLLADSTDMQLLVRVLANPQLLRVRQASL